MHLFLTVVGAVAVLATLVIFACTAFGYAVGQAGRFYEFATREAKINARKELGRELVSLCHWFSENDGAWLAVKEVGRGVMAKGQFDVSETRDRWRAACQSSPTK